MLNFTFAGYGNRIVAQIIDSLIVGFAVSIIAIPIFGISIFSGVNMDDPSDISAMFAGLAILPLVLFAFVAPVVYEVLMISSAKQATFGKMLMKIKVVDEAGLRLTLGAAIGRTLIKYVSSQLCILLWLWPLFNDKEQALHDLIVKDYVIRS